MRQQTKKNLKLVEYLIKIHSNENNIILDPFMGGGTTAIACMNTNRKFIGIELDKNSKKYKFQGNVAFYTIMSFI